MAPSSLQPKRILFYGAPSAVALAVCASLVEQAGARVHWRNAAVFTPDQVESCDAVVCLAGAPSTRVLAEAYGAREVTGFALAPDRDPEVVRNAGGYEALARFLGVELSPSTPPEGVEPVGAEPDAGVEPEPADAAAAEPSAEPTSTPAEPQPEPAPEPAPEPEPRRGRRGGR